MKYRHLAILLLLSFYSSRTGAQILELWGSSVNDGENELGFIYKTDENGENWGVVHHFEGGELGGSPSWNLFQSTNGRIYGVTSGGGEFDNGVIFSISPQDSSYLVHHDFEPSLPAGSLMEASNGKLYGFGFGGSGYIYEFDPETEDFEVIHEFTRTDGRIAFRDNFLIEVSENILYGVTQRGGSIDDDGLIFKYDINATKYEVQYEFDRTEGYRPECLRISPEGALYGITSWTDGRIYNYNAETNEVSTVHEFEGINGIHGDVLLASDGNYYSITGTDGVDYHGSLYQVIPEPEEFTTLHSFLEHSGPHIPDARIIQASNGNLYGTTRYAGYATSGITLFEYNITTQSLSIPTSVTEGFSINGITEIEYCMPTEQTVERVECDSYSFNGNDLTETGSYRAIFLSRLGCDSLVKLNLTINRSHEVTELVSIGGSYLFGDQTLTESGEYSATFQNQFGCDSLVNLRLEILPLSTFPKNSISVFPNPTSDRLIINLGDKKNVKLTITNVAGKEISSEVKSNIHTIEHSINGPNGLYLVNVESDGIRHVFKVIKQ